MFARTVNRDYDYGAWDEVIWYSSSYKIKELSVCQPSRKRFGSIFPRKFPWNKSRF